MSKNIFDIQPEWCRMPLECKEIDWGRNKYDKNYYNSIIFYDPTELYKRINKYLDPFKRIQSIDMRIVFPNEKGICACGCNAKLIGRRTRWASEKCSDWAYSIFSIISGSPRIIYFYLWRYYGDICFKCKRDQHNIYKEDIEHLPDNHYLSNISCLAVDHIYPVKHGGGGGWLSNYQLLCHKCHTNKTNEDFGWKKEINDSQLEIKYE